MKDLNKYWKAAYSGVKMPRKMKKRIKRALFTLIKDLKEQGIWDKFVRFNPHL